MEEAKPFYNSKIFWWNILGGGTALAIEVGTFLVDSGVIPRGAGIVGLGVGNILLRFFTSKPIKLFS